MPSLAGSSSVLLRPRATLYGGSSELGGWTAEESQSMRVTARGFASMEIITAQEAAPDDQPFVFVRQVSMIYPAPTLNDWARPIDWVPTSGVNQEWGRLRVMFGGEDVTYWAGVACEVKSWVINEPFGWARAEIGFPQIAPYSPLPPWLTDWINVDIRQVRPDGSEKILWCGLFADEEDVLESDGSHLVIQLIGALYQADLYQMPPAITPREGLDIADIIKYELSPSTRPNLRTMPVQGGPMGITTKAGGSWDALLTGYVQGLLDQTAYVDGTGVHQWTVKMEERQPRLLTKDTTTVHWTMRCGQPGITHNLSRDLSMMPNIIYGEGVDPDQCHWRNTRYPNLRTDAAPVFPGTVINPGDSGGGISTYEQELWNNGWPVVIDDYYDPDEEWIIESFQAQAGIVVDGSVGPQTWAAIFQTGSNGGDLSSSFFMPLYFDTRVQKYIYNASGAIIGINPAFDAGKVRVERHENFGNYIGKQEAIVSSVNEIARDGGNIQQAGYAGTIILKADPNQGSKWDIRSGENFLLQGHRGMNRLLHISQAEHNWEAKYVTLTVDERARDQATVAAIISRDRENHDPARRKKTQHRNSKNIEDRRAQWDCENGSGVIPRHGTFAGLWNVLKIPTGEVGNIVRTEFTLDTPARFSVGVFDRPTTHSILSSHGASPLDPDYWDSFPEDTGLIVAWGGDGQAAGFYPGQESNEDDPLTGRLVDDSSWYFQSAYPPWLWVAIWVESPSVNYCTGRLFAGIND